MADTPLTPIANLKARADDQGRLKVVVTGAGSGGTSATDGDVFTAGSDAGTPAMGAYQSVPSAVTDGDVAILGITAQRTLKVTLFDSAGSEQAPGAGTQYTEDAAAAANPVGTALMLVREDARAGSLVSTDGDNVAARGTNAGELYVKDFDVEDRVDGIEGLLTTIDSDTGALAGTVAGAELQVDVVASLPAGTNAIGKLSANSGVDIGDVDVTSVVPGVGATNLGKAEDAAHSSGDVGVAAMTVRQDTAAALSGTDADYQPLISDANGRLHVLDANSAAIAASLSVVDDWDNGASDGVSISGDVAHDSADAGEPVKVGYKAVDLGATPTAVSANDRTNGYALRCGVPFVLGGHPNIVSVEAAYTTAQTDAAIVDSIAAGTRIVVTAVAAVVDNATSVDVGFRIGFHATTTPTTTGVILTHPGLKASTGMGFSRGDGSGILGIGGDGDELRITSEVPTSGSLRVLVTYFTIATG